ncbi:uncharacterized protein [Rutidosis leptorrhynchoides]|uniref:uncharacterized protein isoform X1 n=1 Tax=Rutidosis leptorrhynchoides TaxID=125765 RepID=UPI003A99607B
MAMGTQPVFNPDVFKKVLSIFITIIASILKLSQACLDVVFNLKARHCIPFYVKLRYLLKVVSAHGWAFSRNHVCSRHLGRMLIMCGGVQLNDGADNFIKGCLNESVRRWCQREFLIYLMGFLEYLKNQIVISKIEVLLLILQNLFW